MREPAIEVIDLVKSYGSVQALRGATWTAERGAVTSVLGPNGAGKTTALEICEGFRRADSGRIRVLGLDPVAAARELRSRVGITLQAGGVPPGASAREVVEHVSHLYAHPLAVGPLLARLGIDHLGRTPFRRLSGGQQRAVAIALAVVGRPELVILDEPTTGLDPQARSSVWHLVEDLRRSGVSVVLTTHLLDEAQRLSDRIVLINAGEVAACGSVAELVGEAEPYLLLVATSKVDTIALASASGCRVEAVSPGRFTLRGPVGSGTLADVMAWCRANDVVPTELSVRSRSLEDVYLEAVGATPSASGDSSEAAA